MNDHVLFEQKPVVTEKKNKNKTKVIFLKRKPKDKC